MPQPADTLAPARRPPTSGDACRLIVYDQDMEQSLDRREPQIFLNGRMLPASQAHLNVYDAGVVLGATVTELVRTFRKQLFRLDDHLGRLAQSLHFVGFDIGMSMNELGRTVRELVAHNAQLVGPEDELGLVIF